MDQKVIQASSLKDLVVNKATVLDEGEALLNANSFFHKILEIPNTSLRAHGLLGGCGVMNMYNFTDMSPGHFSSSVKALKKAMLAGESGYRTTTLLARLGFHKNASTEIYPGFHKALLDCGFKVIAEYRNYAHPAWKNDYQRLYMLDLYDYEKDTPVEIND